MHEFKTVLIVKVSYKNNSANPTYIVRKTSIGEATIILCMFRNWISEYISSDYRNKKLSLVFSLSIMRPCGSPNSVRLYMLAE